MTLTRLDNGEPHKVLIIDGYNMIHRCRFEWGGGQARGDNKIIYNFLRTLRATVEEFSPQVVYFPLDGKPEHRLNLYEDYKANRRVEVTDPEEIEYWKFFNLQKRSIINLVKNYLPVITAYHPKYEGDDIVLYLVKDALKKNPLAEITIVSSDTDFIQILNTFPKNVSLWNPISKKYRENTEYDYVAWKSMVGDKSDNIPGVKGIGKVGATKILLEAGKLKEKLKDPLFKTAYEKSYQLIELSDMSVDHSGIEFSTCFLDKIAINAAFITMKFSSMLKQEYNDKFYRTFENIELN